MSFKTATELLELCDKDNISIYEASIRQEMIKSELPREEIKSRMLNSYTIMKNAIYRGLDKDKPTLKGKIIGGEAKLLRSRYEHFDPVCGITMSKAISYALSTMEVNASMGKIVAAPTAGSCGVLPAVFLSIQNSHNLPEENILNGLLTASAVGLIIAQNATLSGAQGGCQAEIGSAAAMAAAGVVEALGGTPTEALHASSIALKNLLGLVCDPIAGLVESPCSKRNAIGTANALIAAEMALAGITSVIPFDEVVEAMYKVGLSMPCSLRETAQGGVAATKTAREIEKSITSFDV